MERRQFVAGMALAAGSLTAGKAFAKASGEEHYAAPPAVKGLKRTVAPPVLQCPAATSIGIAWAVNGLAYGEVEIADNPEFRNARRFRGGGMGLAAMDEQALQVRATGLAPATKYWYRTVTTPVADWESCYSFRIGEPETSAVYSFTTPGPEGSSKICIINDTHCKREVMEKVAKLAASLRPAVTVWNGDATNSTDAKAAAVAAFLGPEICPPGYAAEIPLAFVPGNHDFRGKWAKRLGEVMMERLPEERSPRDWQLGRNFAVRVGDVALIGLDTGEDKPDWHPKWMGLANYSPYRQAQRRWLEEQLERDDVKTAKFKVAACHIPLFDADPEANPGDRLENWADWQKECAEAWGPLFGRHGVSLVACGHTHRFRWDEPSPGRNWAQVVGGGTGGKPGAFPTVIELDVQDGRLQVRVFDAFSGRIVCEQRLSPGRV